MFGILYLLFLHAAFAPSVCDLGADDFATRERAEARLTRWADVCWPLLDRPFGDPEVRRRAGRVVGRVMPGDCPPVAALSGWPLPEWYHPVADGRPYPVAIGPCPGPGWRLAYLRPDPGAP